MKKIFLFAIIIILLSSCVPGFAQTSIKKDGNVFSVVKTQTPQDTIMTVFIYKDSHDNLYPIWLNKKTGSCFVIKTSQKSGKQYRQYLSEEIKENVCQYYNVIPVKKD